MINEDELRQDLNKLSKEEIIDVFIQLKKLNSKLCTKLDKYEEQELQNINLDELIDSLPE